MLPGSKFSKGLLLVVVRCQGTVNGPLISFKRLKGLIERLAGLLYVTRRHGGGEGGWGGSQVQIQAVERCLSGLLFS